MVIKLGFYGIGFMGSGAVRYAYEKHWAEIVAAVDIDPKKVGMDVGLVAGLNAEIGVTISNDPDVLREADVVVHTTSSYLRTVYPQIMEIIRRRAHVVSSCEQLAFPYIVDSELAASIDREAKKQGVTVLGTGINPGFAMDTLPIIMTAPTERVESIRVTRRLNAGKRRIPLQRKIGAGMSREEFLEAIHTGRITGHVGLEQSIALIASAMRWPLDRIEVDEVEPVILDREVSSDWITVEPGRVAGVRQKARGISGGRVVIEHEFAAYIGCEDEFDRIEINGVPSFVVEVKPCIHGDLGAISMLINSIPQVVKAGPGLITMKDLPLPHYSP